VTAGTEGIELNITLIHSLFPLFKMLVQKFISDRANEMDGRIRRWPKSSPKR
jgi:hypothetical protein